MRRGIIIAGLMVAAGLIAPATASATRTASVTSIDFGTVKFGTTATQSFTFTISPDETDRFMFVDTGKTDNNDSGSPFSQVTDCPSTAPLSLSPFTCTITVSFKPLEFPSHAGEATVQGNEISNRTVVVLTGRGVPAKKKCKKGKKGKKGAAAAGKKKGCKKKGKK